MALIMCSECNKEISDRAVTCPNCGVPLKGTTNNIIINNTVPVQAPINYGRAKNKWIALLLCIFTIFGHKFYEGKIIMGILYLFTAGFFGIGWIIDIITLICKPNPYYV